MHVKLCRFALVFKSVKAKASSMIFGRIRWKWANLHLGIWYNWGSILAIGWYSDSSSPLQMPIFHNNRRKREKFNLDNLRVLERGQEDQDHTWMVAGWLQLMVIVVHGAANGHGSYGGHYKYYTKSYTLYRTDQTDQFIFKNGESETKYGGHCKLFKDTDQIGDITNCILYRTLCILRINSIVVGYGSNGGHFKYHA